MSPVFNKLIDICSPLSQELRVLQQRGFQTEMKEDRSPVTEADMLSHTTLIASLPLIENIPVVSEEGIPEDTTLDSYWLIDPIDGTKEFIAGTDDFTIHIGQIIEGEAVLGFVYVPAKHIAYAAIKGQKAYKWEAGDWKEIHSNTRTTDLVSVESRLHKSAADQPILDTYDIKCNTERGSSLKMLAIAEGSADIYVRTLPTKIWDTVPPQVILQAAGGDIVDLEGNSLVFSLDQLENPSFKALSAGLLDLEK